MMVILGVDAHKRTRTLVAIDDAARKLGERTVVPSGAAMVLVRRTSSDV